jgi:DNA-binding MarR family transcriptional regulator
MAKKTVEETKRSAWAAFVTAHAVLLERIETRLAQAKLPALAWYDVLWALERAPGRQVRLHELAAGVVLSRSNLSRLIDRLEDAGLTRREQAGEDGRGYYAVLTDEGAAMRRRMWPVYEAAIAELFDRHLERREADAMRAAFKRMLDAARAGDA